MMTHTLLILMPLGSEVRQFGHSGLISKLLDEGWQVVVAAKTVDDDLREQLDSRVDIVPLPPVSRPFCLEMAEVILDKAHALREKRSGKAAWHYQRSAPKNWKHSVLFSLQDMLAQLLGSIDFLYWLGLGIEQRLQRSFLSPEWSDLLRRVSPAVVLVNVPKVNRISPGLSAAAACGCPTAVMYHTWKDVSAAGRLNHEFSAIGVWNEQMKSELQRQNPHIDPETVRVVGCAHFDCVGRKDLLIPEQDFRTVIGAKASSRLLFFPASAPWVVPQEERYIALIWEEIRRGTLGDDVELVVRLNPMDNTDGVRKAIFGISPDILVSRPDWHWDKKSNWCFQRGTDLLLYNSLLSYASVCVGIPSTVTIECAVARLPVINIGFDLPGTPALNGPLSSFWQADFYRDVRESGAAALVDTPEALRGLLLKSIGDRDWMSSGQAALLHRQLGVAPGESAECIGKLFATLAAADSAQVIGLSL